MQIFPGAGKCLVFFTMDRHSCCGAGPGPEEPVEKAVKGDSLTPQEVKDLEEIVIRSLPKKGPTMAIMDLLRYLKNKGSIDLAAISSVTRKVRFVSL